MTGEYDTDLIGYIRLRCPKCTNELLYPEDSKYRPLCDRCGRKMRPKEMVKGGNPDGE